MIAPGERPHPGEAHVWHAGLDRAPALEALAECLSAPELARAGSFNLERKRRRYVAAHAFLRRLLGRYLGCAAREVALEERADGKPQLVPPADLRFNLAHSGELAVAVVAGNRDVGADVEQVRELRSGAGLARRVLSARELDRLGESWSAADLLSCWTRKEAVLKAAGIGLRREPATVEVGTGAGGLPTLVTLTGNASGGGQWSVVSVAPRAGYLAAVAFGGSGLELREWAWEWGAE